MARRNPNGSLSIVDRKKALFKLAQGEYVSPEELEATYGECRAVNQIFVHGDPTRNRPVAAVVPAIEWALEALQSVEVDKERLARARESFAVAPEVFSNFRDLYGILAENRE